MFLQSLESKKYKTLAVICKLIVYKKKCRYCNHFAFKGKPRLPSHDQLFGVMKIKEQTNENLDD